MMAAPKETPTVYSNPIEGTSPSHSSADNRSTDVEGKAGGEHVETLETIHTNERVPGHDAYYEKNGLRTYGDGQDHDHEPPMTIHRFMSLLAMAFLWTGSQIPLYLFGAIPPIIYGDIGGVDRYTWFVLGALIALAAVCPFVGSMSDLFGRRYVALAGATILIVGVVVMSTAKNMNIFIAGSVLTGAGAAINELTALAATSELAPTRKRGIYVSALVFTIVPFTPSVLYAQLIARHTSSWRWVGLFCALWASVGLFSTAFFYFPPPRVNSMGLTRREILRQIDWIGGLLSIGGIICFLMSLQYGGGQYKWGSAHVVAPMVIGLVLLIAFCFYEAKVAKYPIFPSRLKQDPRILALTLVITAISGANFFGVLLFWPTQSYNMYGHDPVGVGLRALPLGLGILAGACVVLVLLSVLKGKNRELMIISSIMMTAGQGALAVATVNNLSVLWIILIIGGFGIGGIVVPASIITTIICPDDLIATIAALTLSIRVIGGAVGYACYYNVFVNKFVPNAIKYIGGTMYELNITDPALIAEAIGITGASLTESLRLIPGLEGDVAWNAVVEAGKLAYAESYKYVYYVSIAFGGVSIICACFLGDIEKYMDDHVAVIIN